MGVLALSISSFEWCGSSIAPVYMYNYWYADGFEWIANSQISMFDSVLTRMSRVWLLSIMSSEAKTSH